MASLTPPTLAQRIKVIVAMISTLLNLISMPSHTCHLAHNLWKHVSRNEGPKPTYIFQVYLSWCQCSYKGDDKPIVFSHFRLSPFEWIKDNLSLVGLFVSSNKNLTNVQNCECSSHFIIIIITFLPLVKTIHYSRWTMNPKIQKSLS
jgi:hypothetical protein